MTLPPSSPPPEWTTRPFGAEIDQSLVLPAQNVVVPFVIVGSGDDVRPFRERP